MENWDSEDERRDYEAYEAELSDRIADDYGPEDGQWDSEDERRDYEAYEAELSDRIADEMN